VNFIPPRGAITLHHSEFLFPPRKVITLLISVHVRPSTKRNLKKEKKSDLPYFKQDRTASELTVHCTGT
jgi:hypothetical protein